MIKINNKKSIISLFENMFFLMVISFLFVLFAFNLYQLNFVKSTTNLEHQDIILFQIQNDCFSEKYGIIEEDLFNEDTIKSCIQFNSTKYGLEISGIEDNSIKINEENINTYSCIKEDLENQNRNCFTHTIPYYYFKTNDKKREKNFSNLINLDIKISIK